MTKQQAKRKLKEKKSMANARRVFRVAINAGLGYAAASKAMNAANQDGRQH